MEHGHEPEDRGKRVEGQVQRDEAVVKTVVVESGKITNTGERAEWREILQISLQVRISVYSRCVLAGRVKASTQ